MSEKAKHRLPPSGRVSRPGKRRRSPVLSLLALCVLTAPLAGGDLEETSRIDFDLRDQYGERIAFPSPRGDGAVAVVAYADRRGAEGNRRWAEVLANRYRPHLEERAQPPLRIVPVAHLEGVPRFVRSFVRRGFRGRDVDGSPILSIALDWEGTVARQLGFEPGVPNLAVFGPDGNLRARVASEADARDARKLLGELDRLLAPVRVSTTGGSR